MWIYCFTYTFYQSYFVNILTFFFPTNFPSNNSNSIIIIAVFVIIAAILIVSLLVAVVIHKNKGIAERKELNSFERSDVEAVSTFEACLVNDRIEEDPFAEDFKEDKFTIQVWSTYHHNL